MWTPQTSGRPLDHWSIASPTWCKWCRIVTLLSALLLGDWWWCLMRLYWTSRTQQDFGCILVHTYVRIPRLKGTHYGGSSNQPTNCPSTDKRFASNPMLPSLHIMGDYFILQNECLLKIQCFIILYGHTLLLGNIPFSEHCGFHIQMQGTSNVPYYPLGTYHSSDINFEIYNFSTSTRLLFIQGMNHHSSQLTKMLTFRSSQKNRKASK